MTKKRRLKDKAKVKRIVFCFCVTLALSIVSLFIYETRTLAERFDTPSQNLLPNGSFEEIGIDNIPSGWTISPQGTRLRIENTKGIIGEKAVRLSLDEENSQGRVESPKIVFKGNKTYFFKSYYITNIDFDFLVHYYYKDGTEKLVLEKHYPSVDEVWTTLSTAVPSNEDVEAISFAIHFAENGYIELDGAYCIETSEVVLKPTQKLSENLIPNSDIEKKSTATGKTLSWVSYSIGNNMATTTALAEGDNEYLHTEVQKYVDGETKWQYLPISVEPDKHFFFSVDYRSNTTVDVIAEYELASGGREFSQLGTLLPTSKWTTYSKNFQAIPRSKNMFVSLVLHKEGFVDSDNYAVYDITQGKKTFESSLLSLTFDDEWKSQYTKAFPLLTQYSFPATFYVNSGMVGLHAYMNSNDLKDLLNHGHQLAAHGELHDDMTSISSTLMRKELDHTSNYLKNKFGLSTLDFATPYGKHNAQTDFYTTSLYASHRGTDAGINTKQNFDKYNLKVLFIRNDSSIELIKRSIDEAKFTKSWLILVYHQIGDEGGTNAITPDMFNDQLEVVKQSGIRVVTVRSALEELMSQLE